jgi:hypothetical protein
LEKILMTYLIVYIIGGWITVGALLYKNRVNLNEVSGEEGSEAIVGAVAAMFIWPFVLAMWALHAYKDLE